MGGRGRKRDKLLLYKNKTRNALGVPRFCFYVLNVTRTFHALYQKSFYQIFQVVV